jgi:hypothetical protein
MSGKSSTGESDRQTEDDLFTPTETALRIAKGKCQANAVRDIRALRVNASHRREFAP